MSTTRTIACLTIATACVASFGTAEAVAKPKGVAPMGHSVQEELKVKSHAKHVTLRNSKMAKPSHNSIKVSVFGVGGRIEEVRSRPGDNVPNAMQDVFVTEMVKKGRISKGSGMSK